MTAFTWSRSIPSYHARMSSIFAPASRFLKIVATGMRVLRSTHAPLTLPGMLSTRWSVPGLIQFGRHILKEGREQRSWERGAAFEPELPDVERGQRFRLLLSASHVCHILD